MTVPLLLAIDTSAKPVSCAVVQDDRVLASFFSHTPLTHSQTLMPMIESCLKVAGMSTKDMDALAVNAGPGSFTGVRIGVSAVKGLAFTDDIPCIFVSTLESLAENVRGLPFDGVVCATMDARCQQVYAAVFMQTASGTQERLTEDMAIPIADLQEKLMTLGKPVLLVGDGSELCYRTMSDSVCSLMLAPLGMRFQSAVSVATVGQRMFAEGKTVTSDQLMPMYLRLPQAERELQKRQR